MCELNENLFSRKATPSPQPALFCYDIRNCLVFVFFSSSSFFFILKNPSLSVLSAMPRPQTIALAGVGDLGRYLVEELCSDERYQVVVLSSQVSFREPLCVCFFFFLFLSESIWFFFPASCVLAFSFFLPSKKKKRKRKRKKANRFGRKTRVSPTTSMSLFDTPTTARVLFFRF